MIIRKAKKTEFVQLQDLNNELFEDNGKYDSDLVLDWAHSDAGKKYFKKAVSDPKSICFVAENDEDGLIGYIAASDKPVDYRKSKYLEVDNMGVSPKYRSQGIGQKLMDECKKWAKENGYQRLFVTSYYGNEKAVRFYKKCGFSEIDVSLEVGL